MTTTYVLMQNLKRNPLRSGLTAAAFALPMAVFVVAISMVVALREYAAANEKELRLAVHHKTSIINMLPEGARRKIEALDPQGRRIISVCGMRWFGGQVPNSSNTLQSLAADVDTFPTVYSDVEMTAEEVGRWQRERRAAIVGLSLAEKYGWKLGHRIVLESSVPPYLKLEFMIVKVTEKTSLASFMYFRRDYLDESLRAAGWSDSQVNIFWVKCTSAEALRSLQTEIDALFANSPNETKSEDENAFIAGFTQAIGDIPALMEAMAIVVVIIITLVAGNTMMMSFRERVRELAVFKAIGFQSRRVFFIVLAESTMLALIGSLAGIIPMAVLLKMFPARRLNLGVISSLEVSALAIASSVAIAVLVGIAAGLWPAYQALRLRTADALRRMG